MGELHIFFPDRSGVSFPREGEAEEFVWSVCDVCNKPNEYNRGKNLLSDQIWICEECAAKGYR